MEPFDFVNRANAEFIDRLWEQYRKDPRSVSEQWQAFFSGFQTGINRSEAAPGDFAARVEAEPSVPLTMGVFDLVHTYRELGHFVAKLDPLGHDRPDHPLLHLDNFGMTESDLDSVVGRGSFYGPTNGTLRDLLENLRRTYSRCIGIEFTHISDRDQREWLLLRMEPILNQPPLDPEER